jgi:hypothetical protein
MQIKILDFMLPPFGPRFGATVGLLTPSKAEMAPQNCNDSTKILIERSERTELEQNEPGRENTETVW